MIIEVGEGLTQRYLCDHGFIVKRACARIPLGGVDVTQYLAQGLLSTKGYPYFSTLGTLHARLMKDKHCYVRGKD
jgi:hypothetical protein